MTTNEFKNLEKSDLQQYAKEWQKTSSKKDYFNKKKEELDLDFSYSFFSKWMNSMLAQEEPNQTKEVGSIELTIPSKKKYKTRAIKIPDEVWDALEQLSEDNEFYNKQYIVTQVLVDGLKKHGIDVEWE